MVPGLEKGLMGMQAGGVRQIVLPYGPFSYPNNDPTHDRVGPKPSTFSGQRALNFVSTVVPTSHSCVCVSVLFVLISHLSNFLIV